MLTECWVMGFKSHFQQ